MLHHAEYDFFVSYKAQNANVARSVSEYLTARGARVWFAEYIIEGAIFDDEEAISAAIREGIHAARYYIAFTNDLWAEARWCRQEMQLISQVPNHAQRVLQVYLPHEPSPIQHWPTLEQVHSIHYEGQPSEVAEALATLGWFTASAPALAIEESEPPKNLRSLGYGIAFNAGPFVETGETPGYFTESLQRPGEHYFFRGTVAGKAMHLAVDLVPMRSIFDNLDITLSEAESADDRKLYGAYLNIARRWLEGIRRDEIGYHLQFKPTESSPDNASPVQSVTEPDRPARPTANSHFSMTSVSRHHAGNATWERRYAIALAAPFALRHGELNLTFATSLPDDDLPKALSQFASLAPIFDQLVESVSTQIELSRFRGEWWLTLATRVALVAVAYVLADLAAIHVTSGVIRAAAFTYLGLTVVSLCFDGWLKSTLMHTCDLGTTIGPRIRFMPTFGSSADRVWNRLVGAVASDIARCSYPFLILIPMLLAGWYFGPSRAYWTTAGLLLGIWGALGVNYYLYWGHEIRMHSLKTIAAESEPQGTT